MRGIKFRVWDNARKMMRSEFMISPFGQVVLFKGANDVRNDYLYPLPFEMILMQNTGLKDKAGREIFEGDITKAGALVGVVEWDAEELTFFNLVCDVSFLLSDYNKGHIANFEIIGNVYEHPELLDVGK